MEELTEKEIIENKSDEEEEKLKLLNKVEYTNKQILYKALNYNIKNWKKIVSIKLYNMFQDMIKIYLPISRAKLIDNISSLKSFDEIFNSFKYYIFYIILSSILNIFSQMFSINIEASKNKKLLLNKIVEKDLFFFELYKTGELIGKIDDLDDCDLDILNDCLQIISSSFQILLIGYYLISTSLYLSIILAIAYSFQLIADYCFQYFQKDENTVNLMDLEDKNRNKINELITNIKMIKSFAKEKDEINSLKLDKEKKSLFSSLKFYSLLELMQISRDLEYPILLIFFAKSIIEGKCTLGIFTVFQQYRTEFINCNYMITSYYSKIKEKIETWKKFLELYDFPVKIKSVKNYIPKEIKGKINFENVSFSYPLRPASKVFENLSFNIEPGKILAICGFSGSGKSTISNLLERFYDVDKGNIYIDDIDIKDYNIEYLRKNIGFVEQEPVLNSGSILSNITYSVEHYEENDLKEILKITCIDSFINDKVLFPDGINTLVGERGSRVSGGQKQRIAMARALIKNSKIIIFDEATSALDAESEAEVHKSIYDLVKKRGITLIIIAHRLSTIINADKIIVINKGKVVEIGNHKELMDKNGEYKKLFNKQLVK